MSSPRCAAPSASPRALSPRENAGVNLGRAILHSGTVGAAMTAQNLGIHAVAGSVQPGGDCHVAAKFATDVLEQMFGSDIPLLANVNVPARADRSTPVLVTSLAKFGAVTAALDGDILDFQMTIDPQALDEPGTDGAAVHAGQVSVTWLTGFGGLTTAAPNFTLRKIMSNQS